MRRRIFWAIFGVSAGVLVLVLVLAVAALNSLRERAIRSELERAGQVVAEVVGERPGLAAALLEGERVEAVGQVLAAIRRAAGGSQLGFVPLPPGPGPVATRLGGDLRIDFDRLEGGDPAFGTLVRPGGRTAIVYAVPLGPVGPSGAGVAAILARDDPLDLQVPRPLLLGTPALVAVLAAVVAGSLSGWLSRRLDAVASAARRLSSGDLTARAEVPGDDEVAAVAAGFNEMAARLKESRERERQFLLAVGHDLRTPLTTIAGYAEALEEGRDHPGEIQRIATVLGVESARLRRLIEDVMLLARLESAEFTLRPEPVDVAAHLDGLLAPFRDRSSEVRVRLDTRLEPVGVRMVDPDRLGQVLANLVENALRFTPESGRVEVALAAAGERIRLSVEDTGPGIEPEDLPHIFERFYVTRRYRGVRPEGSGLGLSIVGQLAEAMGGEVEAQSAPGKGTRLTVSLPAPPP